MKRSETILLACCAAAAALCFLPWFSVSFSGNFRQMAEFRPTMSANAFHTFDGVLAFLGALAGAGLLLADRSDMLHWRRKTRLLSPLLACVGSAVCVLIYVSRGGSASFGGISAGRTIWPYATLIVMVIGALAAFLRWQGGLAGEASGEPRAPSGV